MTTANILVITPSYPPDVGGVAQASARRAQQLATQGQLAGILSPHHSRIPSKAPDLIHAYYPSITGKQACELAKKWEVPLLFAARGNDLERDLWLPERRAALLSHLASAQGLAGVTQELTHSLAVLCPKIPVWYVPNSVDTAHFSPQASAKSKQTVMGFVGEARLKKGLPLLLLVFRELKQLFPDLLLWLVGGVRPGRDTELLKTWQHQNQAIAADLQVWPHCDQADLPALYRQIDVVVFPSYQEGCANAALEAMACGRCVVASHVGGFPDFLVSGKNGVLVSPYAHDQWITVLSEILKNTHERMRLGEVARKDMCRDFTPHHEAERWQQIYRDLLAP